MANDKKKEMIVGVNGDLSGNFTKGQMFFLGLQNTVAMSGVILVPILCGMNVSVTLFCAGIGTIVYQLIDKGVVPAFLGGSFAFIAPISVIVSERGIPYAQGGILFVMCFYLFFALLLKLLGPDKVARVFPPVITGPIIMVLGLCLADVGVSEAASNWGVAFLTFAIAVVVSIAGRGFTRILTIVLALAGGYIISIPFGLVDFSGIIEAPWIGVPSFSFPKFDLRAIAAIAPAAIVPCIEHIGDVIALGTTVGKDFKKDPGLPRSLFACGCATLFSGFLGGPPLTIHSENTGVLAITRIYSPFVVRCGALWMALFAFIPKFEALCRSIPTAVLGGVGILLYGMITCVGIRTVVENHVDFSESRNLVIASVIIILAVGGASFALPGGVTVGGMAIAAIAGIILNLVLPEKKERQA
ncbi:MAG: NCS2 family nucleobase:cation symporter [Synergistaceae bacterium]|jgi:uracil permease|nr:NCS2 family nucleobase:cation symporter [Synergistaceae bacterium]